MKWTVSLNSHTVKPLLYIHLRCGTHLALFSCEDGMSVFLNAAVVTKICRHNAIWLAHWTGN